MYTFLKVYEQRNISKASHLLGYSQSTITNHIQILENVLELKLFDRTINGVYPTEKGETFAKYAYQFYDLSKELLDEIHEVQGTVRIKALESLEYTPLFQEQFVLIFSNRQSMANKFWLIMEKWITGILHIPA